MKISWRRTTVWLLCAIILAETFGENCIPSMASTGNKPVVESGDENRVVPATPSDAPKELKSDRRTATPSNADRTFSYMTVVDGYRITIRAEKGVFSEYPSVKIKRVADENSRSIENIIEQKLAPDESIASVVSFDISFYVNSEEIQPDGDVEVIIELADGNEAEPDETAPKVFHVSDDYTAEEVPCEVPESGTIKYFASQFSTYSIVLLELESDYIEIWTVDDLEKINTDYKSLHENYKLMQDIDLTGVAWEPIGKGWEQDYHPFGGSFDGNNHTISNLSLTPGQAKSDRYCYGLFGGVDGGEIKNLNLENIEFIGLNDSADRITYLGGICGRVQRADSIIENCKVSGRIENCNAGRVGGIAGVMEGGTVQNCISDVNITDSSGEGSFAGITIIDGNATVTGCINKGNISTKSNYSAGIAVCESGNYRYRIEDCINEGNLAGGEYIGGIRGGRSIRNMQGEIVRCINRGDIMPDGKSGSVGGIVSELGPQECLEQCYNAGTIQGPSGSSVNLGGIAGECVAGRISDCFNCGTISRNDGGSAGGIVGTIPTDSVNNAEVRNCYNVGKIISSSGVNRTGPIAGSINSQTDMSKNCVFLDTTMPSSDYIDEKGGARRLNDAEMRLENNYPAWDFSSVWKMGIDDYPYPVFIWMDSAPDVSFADVPEEETALDIEDCSPWSEENIYVDSDIVIRFNHDVYGKPGENCVNTFEIRDYTSDEVLFKWTPQYTDYDIDKHAVTLHNVLEGCRDRIGTVLYLYIPDGFFRAADDAENVLKGQEEKGKYSFVLADKEMGLYFVQFKYERNGVMNLHYVQSVREGGLCPSAEAPAWDGYDFADWYTDAKLTHVFDFKTPIRRNYILYAKYVKSTAMNTGSGQDANDQDTGSENNSVYSSSVRDSGFSEARDSKTGELFWRCERNGELVKGYVKGLYYNGEPGNFLFDEKGFMLTGWHYADGKMRYFDERPGHKGYEITARDVQEELRKKSAYQELSKYNYAGTFASDLNFEDAAIFLVDNFDEIKLEELRSLITGQFSDTGDRFTNNKEHAKKYLREIIDNLCGASDKSYFITGDSKIADYIMPLAGQAGYGSIEELYDQMKQVTGYAGQIEELFVDYANHVAMLESVKKMAPDLGDAADELISAYNHSVSANLEKKVVSSITGQINVKNAVDAYNSLITPKEIEGLYLQEYIEKHLASNQALEGLVTALFKDSLQNAVQGTRLDSIENIIYSAGIRSEALAALKNAESKLLNTNADNSAMLEANYKEYVDAYNLAKEATRIQYDNMSAYYAARGDNEKALKVLEDKRELETKMFYYY